MTAIPTSYQLITYSFVVSDFYFKLSLFNGSEAHVFGAVNTLVYNIDLCRRGGSTDLLPISIAAKYSPEALVVTLN